MKSIKRAGFWVIATLNRPSSLALGLEAQRCRPGAGNPDKCSMGLFHLKDNLSRGTDHDADIYGKLMLAAAAGPCMLR